MLNAWPLVPMGDFLSERRDSPDPFSLECGETKIVSKISFSDGQIEFRTDSATKTKMITIYPGDLVVSGINAAKGAIAIYPNDMKKPIAATIHYSAYEIDQTMVDSNFLWWLLRSNKFKEILDENLPNGIKTELKAKRLLPIKIPLPPFEEQRQLATKIEQLTMKIDKTSSLRKQSFAEIDALIGIILKHKFTGDPCSRWSEGYLGDYVLDICYGTSEKTHDEIIGIPILRMGNIQNGKLATRDLKYLEIAEKDRGKWILQPLDILVNRTNSAELVGKCAVFNLEGEWGFASYLIRLRLDLNRADPRFVAYYINSPIGRDYMFRERKQMTGQANVNSKKLRDLPIKLPEIEEQHRIVKYLNALQTKVDQLRSLQFQSTAELNALQHLILDKAFNGKLLGEFNMDRAVSTSRQKQRTINPTPYKDDAAIVCVVLDELQKRNRPTDEFFIQKHLFAGKYHWRIPINSLFDRKAAGPWSREFKEKAIFAGQKTKWFKWKNDSLVPDKSFNKGIEYAKKVLGDQMDSVVSVVVDLERFGSNGLSRWMTVLKVVDDLKHRGEKVTRQSIQNEIDNWPGKRKKEIFNEENVDYTIDKMCERGWIVLDSLN